MSDRLVSTHHHHRHHRHHQTNPAGIVMELAINGDAKLAEQRKRMRDNLVKCKSGSGKKERKKEVTKKEKKEEEINKNRFVSFSLPSISENHHHLFMHPIF